jgi:hypothetical protein
LGAKREAKSARSTAEGPALVLAAELAKEKAAAKEPTTAAAREPNWEQKTATALVAALAVAWALVRALKRAVGWALDLESM